MGSSNQSIYDVLGVGLGPNHLSLAITLDELLPAESRNVLFLEKRDNSSWHPGMMLPGCTLQTSFLKDLVTLRNPTSPFSFLNYYHHIGRLHEFVNLRTFFPVRQEFSDYLNWVAGQFPEWMRYGAAVREVLPVANADGVVETLEVVWEDKVTGREERRLTRNLCIAAGHKPKAPPCFDNLVSPSVIHADYFMHQIEQLPDPDRPRHVVLVGAGQSAVELVLWFLDNRPQDTITLVVSKFALGPANSSHFVNEAFGPSFEDFFFDLAEEHRDHLVEVMQNTNYGVADPDILERLYGRIYQMKTVGKESLKILNSSRVEAAKQTPDGIEVEIRHKLTGAVNHALADLVVLATGYEATPPLGLDALNPYVLRDGKGRYMQNRDYSIATAESFRPRIYLQGYGEHRFGITEVTLSILPQRAERIAKSICNGLQKDGTVEFPTVTEMVGVRDR